MPLSKPTAGSLHRIVLSCELSVTSVGERPFICSVGHFIFPRALIAVICVMRPHFSALLQSGRISLGNARAASDKHRSAKEMPRGRRQTHDENPPISFGQAPILEEGPPRKWRLMTERIAPHRRARSAFASFEQSRRAPRPIQRWLWPLPLRPISPHSRSLSAGRHLH